MATVDSSHRAEGTGGGRLKGLETKPEVRVRRKKQGRLDGSGSLKDFPGGKLQRFPYLGSFPLFSRVPGNSLRQDGGCEGPSHFTSSLLRIKRIKQLHLDLKKKKKNLFPQSLP